jgi:hypothetical protein
MQGKADIQGLVGRGLGQREWRGGYVAACEREGKWSSCEGSGIRGKVVIDAFVGPRLCAREYCTQGKVIIQALVGRILCVRAHAE